MDPLQEYMASQQRVTESLVASMKELAEILRTLEAKSEAHRRAIETLASHVGIELTQW